MNSDIQIWQKNILELPEEKFFNIMRLYLGEIKTPYNKQRLTEQLASFLRTKENIQGIISLIDAFDLKFLSAIYYMPGCTTKFLSEFFLRSYSVQEIYSAIANLSDRMIIFSDKNTSNEQRILRINPLLLEEIRPMLDINCILEKPEFVSISISNEETDSFSMSQNFLAAFISYIKHENLVCRNDGIIKKNHLSKLEDILKISAEDIQLLFNSFVNIGLIHEGQKYIELYENKLEAFCNLEERFQYAFLCVAACTRFGREQLKKNSQLLLDCLASMPECGLSADNIERLAWLISRTKGETSINTNTRFGKLLQAAKQKAMQEESQESNNTELSGSDIINSIVSTAIKFGLFIKAGTDEKGKNIYKPAFSNTSTGNATSNASKADISATNISETVATTTGNASRTSESSQLPKVLNVDSTFTVTLMPGLNLKSLNILTDFLTATSYGIATYFEITRNTVQNAFEKGLQPKDIFSELEKYSLYELPQNLKISIEDWHHIYSSAAIYYGYIIKVSEENIPLVKNNQKLCRLLKEEIASGVYLLSVPVGSDIKAILTSCGWNLSANIKTAGHPLEQSSFPPLTPGKQSAFTANSINAASSANAGVRIQSPAEKFEKVAKTEQAEQSSQKDLENHIHEGINLINGLKKKLEQMELSPAQKEILSAKISARLVISEKQLLTTCVRTEILEAEGMDYAGKIHLLEAAAEAGDLVEVQMPNPVDRNKFLNLIGRPLHIAKLPGECSVRFLFEPEGTEETLLVSRITHLKRLIM